MNYDFVSYRDRMRTRASKWVNMHAQKEDVPAGVVPMTVADMDFMTAPEITQAISAYAQKEILGYSRPTDAYLQSVVDYFYKKHGYLAQKEWILTSPGLVPALATALRALSRAGDAALVLSPVYEPFYEVVEGQGRRLLKCSLIEKDGRYFIDFALFERLCREEKPKAFLLCSPHNPSGRVWEKEELARLCDICAVQGVGIVSDEIHSDLLLGEKAHHMIQDVHAYGKKAIQLTSSGKAFNIQALQCANVFIQDVETRERFQKENLFVGIERANVLGMVATMAAYQKGGAWQAALKQVILKNLHILSAWLLPYRGKISMMQPDASFLCWLNFQNMGVSHQEFIDFLISCDFFVTNGLFFGQEGEYHFRINLGLPEKALRENLARLKNGLRERYGV